MTAPSFAATSEPSGPLENAAAAGDDEQAPAAAALPFWMPNPDTPEIKTRLNLLKLQEKTFSNRDSPRLFYSPRLRLLRSPDEGASAAQRSTVTTRCRQLVLVSCKLSAVVELQ